MSEILYNMFIVSLCYIAHFGKITVPFMTYELYVNNLCRNLDYEIGKTAYFSVLLEHFMAF